MLLSEHLVLLFRYILYFYSTFKSEFVHKNTENMLNVMSQQLLVFIFTFPNIEQISQYAICFQITQQLFMVRQCRSLIMLKKCQKNLPKHIILRAFQFWFICSCWVASYWFSVICPALNSNYTLRSSIKYSAVFENILLSRGIILRC